MPEDITKQPLHYAIVTTPIGKLLLAGTSEGLVQVAFEHQGFEHVVRHLELRFGVIVERDDTAQQIAQHQLAQYFAGTREYFDLPVTLGTAEGFLGRAQQQLTTIPYGETRTYGELAAQLGSPGAARAVGTACAQNPIPIIRPCHRVVRSDGSPGEYLGTPEVKQYLIALEQRTVDAEERG